MRLNHTLGELNDNNFVLGDQVVMTPFFTGSEPATAPSGKYQGTTILTEAWKDNVVLDYAGVRATDPGSVF